MKNTNLFKHATKELVTDAFITWLLYFLDSDHKYAEYKKMFFDQLLLKPEDQNRSVKNIDVKRQDTTKNGRVDLILTFQFEREDITQTILFENKTWTTTSTSQLNKYKTANPNAYKYVYLKLAYINYFERKITTECGYDFIDVSLMSDTLDKIRDVHPFIEHYLEYIDGAFKNFIKQISEELYINKNYSILSEEQGQAQQYLLDSIYKELDGKLEKLFFQQGSSFGRPWTELIICGKLNVYGNNSESVFWRIDTRSGKFYIRLNQYSNIGDDYKNYKKHRLLKLREIASEIIAEYPLLKMGKLSDKGTKETEIIIFFLEDNDLKILFEALPKFSFKFNEMYEKELLKN